MHLILSLVIFSLIACYPTSNNVYQAESTKGVNFKNYKTYAWLPTKQDTTYIKLADKKVVESALAKAVSQQLTEHGMTMDTVNPDCLFTYTLVLKKTTRLEITLHRYMPIHPIPDLHPASITCITGIRAQP